MKLNRLLMMHKLIPVKPCPTSLIVINAAERLTDFLASQGVTFFEWLAKARNYVLCHLALYNEFHELEKTQ